jgi:hypothetical protein
MKRKALLPLLLTLVCLTVRAAPDTGIHRIDIRRVKLHEDIDKYQLALLKAHGKNDSLVIVSKDEEVNLLVTDILTRQVDEMQDSIELSARLDHRLKVKYLTGLQGMLKGLIEGWHQGSFHPDQTPVLYAQFLELMQTDLEGKSILPVVEKYPYEAGNILVNASYSVFFENAGFQPSKIILFRKYCSIHPDQILPKLEYYADVPFADSLVKYAAHAFPNQFYDYAAASRTNVGRLIRQNPDTLVRAITQMANSKSGRLYYPFLDEVMHGRQTIASIGQVMNDSFQYYDLLVQTEIANARRIHNRDTPMVAGEVTKMLQRKAQETFINEINALHDSPDPLRFRILEGFTPQQLYFLIVLGEDVIYTSSYKGVYNRMMERMRIPSGDTLLMSVQFDHFKKFIKMAAGYNKLDHFLYTFPDSSAQRLMIAFARGLERSGSLEEAVDVADSYGSINTPSIKKLIDREIGKSLIDSRTSGDKRSKTIYHILQTIFRSSSDSSIDLSEKLGIPPVYKVNYSRLADDQGRVIQLVFFYGDKDGAESYANFMGMFSAKDWKVTKNKEWVEIRSIKGKPVWIFANLPLDNSRGDDPDAKAQEHLLDFLETNKLKPTIVIHRGHSYHVKYTIKQLPESADIVILGSCGGYHNLDDVLRTCPDAHIISSKEVGTKNVNEPILRAINDELLAGRSIEWIPLWKSLAAQFTTPEGRERFDNYIPPHKNLGALFIKAYSKAMESKSSSEH